MKLILATDALEDVRWADARGLCDGVLLPDAALHAAADPDAAANWLRDFCRGFAGPVFFVPPVAPDADADAWARAARDAARDADGAIAQIPLRDDTLRVIHDLATEGVEVAATFVASATQALAAAKAGATACLLDIDRLVAAGLDAAAVLRDARTLRDASALETDLVALFPSGPESLVRVASAGADAAVVPTPTLRAWLAYPLTDSALAGAARRPVAGRRLRADE